LVIFFVRLFAAACGGAACGGKEDSSVYKAMMEMAPSHTQVSHKYHGIIPDRLFRGIVLGVKGAVWVPAASTDVVVVVVVDVFTRWERRRTRFLPPSSKTAAADPPRRVCCCGFG
jgi:hypothetical protein